MVFSAFPRSGPPPRFRDYEDYAAVVGQLEQLGLHRGLHAHLVGHPPPPSPRHDRDPHLRRRHARRGRRRDRGVLPGARQTALRAVRGGRGDPVVPPDPHEREQVARRQVRTRGAGHGPRDRRQEPAAGRAAHPQDGQGASAARGRPRLGARARGDLRDPRARLVRRSAAARLQRESGHRRGRPRDRGRDRGAPHPRRGRRSRRSRLAQFPQNGRTSIVPICATG